MLISTRINRDHLRAALVCAATADIRYYLNGVLIELYPDRAFIVGCDGHRLAIFRDDASGTYEGASIPDLLDHAGVTFIMPRDMAAKVKSDKHLRTIGLEFDTESQIVTLDEYGARSSAKAAEGRFPDWRRVIPAKGDGVAAQINPSFVGDFAKLAKLAGRKDNDVRLWQDAAGSTLVTINGAPQFVGVVMAMNCKGETRPSCAGFADKPAAPKVKPEKMAA